MVSISYCCITNYSKTLWFKITNIYYYLAVSVIEEPECDLAQCLSFRISSELANSPPGLWFHLQAQLGWGRRECFQAPSSGYWPTLVLRPEHLSVGLLPNKQLSSPWRCNPSQSTQDGGHSPFIN